MINILQIQSIEPSLIMYGFGLFFGILSILYFAKDILLSLSITTKNYSLYVLSLIIFTTSLFIQTPIISLIIITISGVAYSTAVIYTWYKNNLRRSIRFLILVISSILFLFIATGIQESIFKDYRLSIILLAIVGLGIFIFLSILDIQESDPLTYTLNLKENVKSEEEVTIGDIKINNTGNFKREFRIPNFRSKLSKNGEEYDLRCWVNDKNEPLSISRKNESNYKIKVDFRTLRDPNNRININTGTKFKIVNPSPQKYHTITEDEDIIINIR
jgi:hypothetical protein